MLKHKFWYVWRVVYVVCMLVVSGRCACVIRGCPVCRLTVPGVRACGRARRVLADVGCVSDTTSPGPRATQLHEATGCRCERPNRGPTAARTGTVQAEVCERAINKVCVCAMMVCKRPMSVCKGRGRVQGKGEGCACVNVQVRETDVRCVKACGYRGDRGGDGVSGRRGGEVR